MKVWISFAADPQQKARCLSRLREAQPGPDNQPSDCAAGGKHRFSEELGVPEALAVVIDVLCWLRRWERIWALSRVAALIGCCMIRNGVLPSAARWGR
jgi:hypothetical protein